MAEKPPKVTLLKAFRPDQQKVADATLSYPDLETKVVNQQSYDALRWEQFLGEDDELAQAAHAENLASQYLLQTALRLNQASTPELKEMWSQRFTQASIELFGRPDPEIAKQLFREQGEEIEALFSDPNVDFYLLDHLRSTYRALELATTDQGERPDFHEASAIFRDFLESRYKAVFEIFEGLDEDTKLSPSEVLDIFAAALDKLKEEDSAWEEWEAELTDSTSLAVASKSQRIRVGKNRTAIKASEVKGLFGHEILVHAKRAVEARKVNDEELATGLPHYLQGEEGVAIFIESSLNGKTPPKVADRYIDTAMALGDILPRSFTRKELFDFVMTREIVRAQAEQQTRHVDTASLQKKAWEHVNRIYRGSAGDDHIGVFTKDVVYYAGFQEIGEFITKKLKDGMDVEQLFSYLTSGKFDPLNPLHTKYIATS